MEPPKDYFLRDLNWYAEQRFNSKLGQTEWERVYPTVSLAEKTLRFIEILKSNGVSEEIINKSLNEV